MGSPPKPPQGFCQYLERDPLTAELRYHGSRLSLRQRLWCPTHAAAIRTERGSAYKRSWDRANVDVKRQRDRVRRIERRVAVLFPGLHSGIHRVERGSYGLLVVHQERDTISCGPGICATPPLPSFGRIQRLARARGLVPALKRVRFRGKPYNVHLICKYEEVHLNRTTGRCVPYNLLDTFSCIIHDPNTKLSACVQSPSPVPSSLSAEQFGLYFHTRHELANIVGLFFLVASGAGWSGKGPFQAVSLARLSVRVPGPKLFYYEVIKRPPTPLSSSSPFPFSRSSLLMTRRLK